MSVVLFDYAYDWVEPVAPEVPGSGGGYTVSCDLYRATIDNDLVEDVSDLLIGGYAELNVDRDVKLAASFTVRDPGRITPYTDYLAPFLRREYDDGRATAYEQVGLYAIDVPPGTYSPDDAVATFQGSDLTAVLAGYVYTDSSSSSAGTTYTGQVGGVCTNAGLTRHNIPSSSATLPKPQSWPVGTTRLEKANKLLDLLGGWYHLGMDLDGKISTPGAPQDLASMEPWRVLTDDDLLKPIAVNPTGQGIANVIVVVNDDATSAPLFGTARNDDPASPTSTVAIGREIARVEHVSGTTTQAALDALAARLLAEGRSYYRTLTITTLHDPTALIAHQCVQLTLTGEYADLSGRYWIRTAKLGLTADSPLVMELNQVTSDLTAGRI